MALYWFLTKSEYWCSADKKFSCPLKAHEIHNASMQCLCVNTLSYADQCIRTWTKRSVDIWYHMPRSRAGALLWFSIAILLQNGKVALRKVRYITLISIYYWIIIATYSLAKHVNITTSYTILSGILHVSNSSPNIWIYSKNLQRAWDT